MEYPVHMSKKTFVVFVTATAMAVAIVFLESACSRGQAANANASRDSAPKSSVSSLDLSPSQLNSIKIEPVGSYQFPVEKDAVGNIDFDEDLSVQVFPAYQGTILKTFGELGARVQKDQPLYTIKSPDLIQAESNLIGAAATFELTSKELVRAQGLTDNGVPSARMEQATSDPQTAEGAFKAARDAVLVFGKTDAEIDQMIASRKIDPALVVRSPIAGKITLQTRRPDFWCSRESSGALLGGRVRDQVDAGEC